VKDTVWHKYSFFWITLGFFVFSLAGHWIFAWYAFVDEQAAHGLPAERGSYLVEVLRDTLENWQSEFLQLMWQVAGLAYLFYVGSTQSREGEERMEAKMDAMLARMDPKEGEGVIRALDRKYLRK